VPTKLHVRLTLIRTFWTVRFGLKLAIWVAAAAIHRDKNIVEAVEASYSSGIPTGCAERVPMGKE
jgi:hypothetical protein